MSNKQSDSNFGEALGAVLMAWSKYPEIVQAVFYAAQDVGDDLRAALAPKPQPNMVAASSNVQQLPPPVDEQPEAFTPAAPWLTTEDDSMGFTLGLRLGYPSQQGGIYRMPDISRLWR